ncbi:transcriptional regulator with XRE-family HTH domain [Thermocatellispora tengchongensis]|uniref:Transcriptional regulator with XRE-family HTH domain n=1 Tax=Thermocatellispora tengchongensis TaxID=1073253 RepID=A0A840P8E8_9ACTN|nr:helix-turn-helix transcriptional regulator [Thermocatellispora tengchongensis]MBB5135562.1 transcriptional regulator with XRE-family HTH domain [Thermocatellispora tengchongensis]
MPDNQLGEFLRARRAGLLPQDVGMAAYGTRRVTGLRREEVAVLAGVNADYYTRLEQGRERHPSPQVLDALSRALRLDTDARAHLYRLAGTSPSDRFTHTTDRVSPALRQLMDGYPGAPAFVINLTLDILAVNTLAAALYSPFEQADNLARMTFLDPAGRQFYTQWSWTAQAVVANLRQAAGLDPGSPRLRELVRTLTEHSADFARLWNTHTVRGKTQDAKHLLHPDVGPLTLTYQAFDVRHSPGQQLVIYQAEPGSPSAQALNLLGSIHATWNQTEPRPS